MMRARLCLALVAMLAAAPATARLAQAGPDGFVSENSALLPGAPASVWAALLQWGRWWDPAHSYSQRPGQLQLDAQAGGLLSERWDGKSVAHAMVLNVMPPNLLRLSGGFGPLQALPVSAVLDVTLQPEAGSTRMIMTYRVAGTPAQKLDALAGPVDAVMSAAFARLTTFARTGQP